MDGEVTLPGQVFAHIAAHVDSNQINSVENKVCLMLQFVETHEVRNIGQLFPLNPNLIFCRVKLNYGKRRKPNATGIDDHFLRTS